MTCARRLRLLLCLLLPTLTAALAGACAVTPIQLPAGEGVSAGLDAQDKTPDAGSGDVARPPPSSDATPAGSDASPNGDRSPGDTVWSSEGLRPPGGDLSIDAGQGSDGSSPKPDKTGKPTG
jgi:hypothetical protein